ncbi:MAG: alpha-L-fucosidase [Candidatus Aminicenantes bacterium]|nr:alpha-L-fucosidase [Candidatus Aminicenantes bacterium]
MSLIIRLSVRRGKTGADRHHKPAKTTGCREKLGAVIFRPGTESLKTLIILCVLFSSFCTSIPPDIPANAAVPSSLQVAYQKMEFIGFIHFSINTFTDKEWGYGNESPSLFFPTAFDADQWASVAKRAGMKELILTAKHHDGFCLWPSRYTEHSVKNSPWKNGQGDVVREFVDACRRHGLKAGLYLSPWDRNFAGYGSPAYIDYYRNQLKELLTEYGEISELWFDGANGGSGWYGGADETRTIDRKTYYRWPETWALAKKIQPKILLFSDAGPDIRWTGNESGYAGETNWSTINTRGIVVGKADQDYLNTGDPDGKQWLVPLCDTSIRPDWFYHPSQDDQVKSLHELLEITYNSVGRNSVLLLNIPPDKRGLFHENDVAALMELRRVLAETFKKDLAAGCEVSADNIRLNHPKFSPGNCVDEDKETYWACDDGIRRAVVEVNLKEDTLFDRIVLQEPIRFGQRIAVFSIEGRTDGKWKKIAQGTTIGYKRILRIPSLEADRVRLIIHKSNNSPALSHLGLYKASEKEDRF